MAGFFQSMPGMVVMADGFRPVNRAFARANIDNPKGKSTPGIGEAREAPKPCPKPTEI